MFTQEDLKASKPVEVATNQHVKMSGLGEYARSQK